MKTISRSKPTLFTCAFIGATAFGTFMHNSRAASVNLTPTNAQEFQQALADASDGGQYAGKDVEIDLLEYNDYGTISGTPVQMTMNLSTEPLFVDAANGNFRLSSGSPLLAYFPIAIYGSRGMDLWGKDLRLVANTTSVQ